MKLLSTLSFCLGFLFTPIFVSAHNGHQAVALPISKITVDGKSNDWPGRIRKYSIAPNDSDDQEDFRANFRVAYNLSEQSLYVIVEVQDSEHILSSELNRSFRDQDTHWLFLDIKHEPRGSGVAFYALSENSFQLLLNQRSWDRDIRNSTMKGVDYAVERAGTITIYEWKIFMGEELYPNRTIGLDHEIVDADEEGTSIKAWGLFGMKNSISNNLGDVFIMEENDSSWGILTGSAQLEESYSNVVPYGLEIQNVDYPDLWTQFPLLGKREFEISLPPGRYRVRSALIGNVTNDDKYLSARDDSGIFVSLDSGKTTAAPAYLVKAQELPDLIKNDTGILKDFEKTDSLIVDMFFRDLMHHYGIPGLSLALIRDNEIAYLKNYGHANGYEKETVKSHHLFDAGSVTKPVFAFLVMQLIEQGVLNLDTPLHTYLKYPDMAHDTTYHQLTARMVLSHQTGWPNWRWGQLNFVNPPGTFGYSGEGFVYLSKVIEGLTDRSIEDLLEEYFLNPLQIQSTHFSNNRELRKNLTHGHDDKYSSALMPADAPNMAYSMNTNAQEFSKFLLALMRREILSEQSYNDMFSKQVDIPTSWSEANTDWEQGFGLGYQLKFSPYGLAFGHSGRNGAYDCSFEVYPDLGVGYVFFTNSSNGFRLKNTIREFLITGHIDGPLDNKTSK